MVLNIKKRLRISNILMILIPICVCIVAGILSLAVFFAVLNGTGVGFDDENFYNGKDVVMKFVGESLESDDSLSSLGSFSSVVRSDSVRLTVVKEGNVYYEYGAAAPSDAALAAMAADGDGVFVADGERQLYVRDMAKGGTAYRVYVYCSTAAVSYRQLKIAAVILVGVIFVLAVVSIVLSDRFLSRFVFGKIERPLHELTAAAKEVSGGNLDYTVSYDPENEFSPVIREFNAMTKQLKESSGMLREEENRRTLMLTGMTHDIKSPLTVISGYADGLCEGVADTPEKRERYLRTIKRKCDEIDSLVRKMMLLTQTEHAPAFPEETIDVAEAVTDFVRSEGERYAERGLSLSFNPGTTLPIGCTKENFKRVLENIADNSLKYKRDGQGSLRIRLTEDSTAYTLTFSDDGTGVPDEDLPHIFEPFYRADKARTGASESHGIGLAVVRRILSACGGQTAAHNNEEGGLDVCVTFGKQDGKNTDCGG